MAEWARRSHFSSRMGLLLKWCTVDTWRSASVEMIKERTMGVCCHHTSHRDHFVLTYCVRNPQDMLIRQWQFVQPALWLHWENGLGICNAVNKKGLQCLCLCSILFLNPFGQFYFQLMDTQYWVCSLQCLSSFVTPLVDNKINQSDDVRSFLHFNFNFITAVLPFIPHLSWVNKHIAALQSSFILMTEAEIQKYCV